MNKVIWQPEFITYTFDKTEPFYNKGYFKLKRQVINEGDAIEEITELTYVYVVSENVLQIYSPLGTFNLGDILEVDKISYIYKEEQSNQDSIPQPPIEKPSEVPEISINNLKIESKKNEIFAINISEIEAIKLEIEIEEYTREVYPEFPFNTIEKNIRLLPKQKISIYKLDKGKIVVINIDDNEGSRLKLEYENNPLYHFSTVKSLKDTIKNMKLTVTEKTDDEYKNLISEKSTYLKKRFGLTKNETQNIELFPAFKNIVNLYCIRELIALSFIQGDVALISNQSYNPTTNLTLGKFKTDGETNNGNIFSITAIDTVIKKCETDLEKSIFNLSYILKNTSLSHQNVINESHCILRKCKINELL